MDPCVLRIHNLQVRLDFLVCLRFRLVLGSPYVPGILWFPSGRPPPVDRGTQGNQDLPLVLQVL